MWPCALDIISIQSEGFENDIDIIILNLMSVNRIASNRIEHSQKCLLSPASCKIQGGETNCGARIQMLLFIDQMRGKHCLFIALYYQ